MIEDNKTDDGPRRAETCEMSGPFTLSPAGRRRRNEMLGRLQHAMIVRRRRRAAARYAAACVPLVILLSLAVWSRFGFATQAVRPIHDIAGTNDGRTPVDPSPDEPAPALTMAHADFRVVRDGDVDTSAMIVRSSLVPHVDRIGDDELLKLLRQAGKDYGLVRVGDRTVLTDNSRPGSVVDPEPGRSQGLSEPAADRRNAV